MSSKTVIDRPKGADRPMRLRYPRSGNCVDLSTLTFHWSAIRADPKRKVSYRLMIYPYKPGQSLENASRGKPVYVAEGIEDCSHAYPSGASALKKGFAYAWKVEADDGIGRKEISEIQGFRPWFSRAATPLGQARIIFDRLDPELHLPHAPVLWGKAVLWRWKKDLPPADPGSGPGEGSETTEPGVWKWTIWGTEAARLYLIEPYWRHARIWWDYSDQEGCAEVLLQVAGPDGFAEPNSADAREDHGVATWYAGPVTVPETCLGHVIYREGNINRIFRADDLDLQDTGELHAFWENLSVRLVAIDAGGNQIGPASDHVSVGCVDVPLINIENCNVEWIWGESPRRRIEIIVRLGRIFPSTGGGPAPSTLLLSGRTSHTTEAIAASVCTNRGLSDQDGMETGIAGTWDGYPAYYCRINDWVDGERHVFTLEQEPEAAGASVGLLQHLIHFVDLHVFVHCIPGMTPRMGSCGRLVSDGEFLGLSCGETYEGHFYDAELSSSDLFAGHMESGLEPIYHLFTRPLSGIRRSVRTVDDTEEVDEQDVDVEFHYTETFYDAEDFKLYLMRNEEVTMIETYGGSTVEYIFRMQGFHAMMAPATDPHAWYRGEDNTTGHLVFDPPWMTMRFHRDMSYWDSELGRYIEDLETLEYRLRH